MSNDNDTRISGIIIAVILAFFAACLIALAAAIPADASSVELMTYESALTIIDPGQCASFYHQLEMPPQIVQVWVVYPARQVTDSPPAPSDRYVPAYEFDTETWANRFMVGVCNRTQSTLTFLVAAIGW